MGVGALSLYYGVDETTLWEQLISQLTTTDNNIRKL